jgi:hypothetical protein
VRSSVFLLRWRVLVVLLLFCWRPLCGVLRRFRWHPLFAFGLLALPLCGAAPTFLCSGKEK